MNTPQSEIPQFKVFMSDKAPAMVGDVLSSGYIGQGERVEEFEDELKALLKYDYGVTVNSATSALWLALHLIGVGPGDDVVSTPMTCTATNEVIINMGANIVWADVDVYGNIDPRSVSRRITPRTKAVMAVDWGGLPVDYDGLRSAIEMSPQRGYHKVPIIEDAAHSILSVYQGQTINKTGGDYIAYSFQAIKHLTTGDGGLLITPEYDYERAKLLRWYGLDRTQGNAMRCRQDIKEAGYKFHMNDINATIGLANLPFLSDIVEAHRSNAKEYDEAFSGFAGVVPRWPTNRISSFWLYPISIDNPLVFESYMKKRSIQVSQTHNRNDVMTCFSKSQDRTYPLTGLDSYFSTMCCIPVGWWLSEDDREYIVECVVNYIVGNLG